MLQKIGILFDGFDKYKNDFDTDILIKNKENCKEKLLQMTRDGINYLQVISDFDRTMSSYMFNGRRNLTSHGVFETDPELSSEVREQFVKLYEKYYAIEIDPGISDSEKIPFMIEWWSKSHNLMVTLNLHEEVLRNTIQQCEVGLRTGCTDFMRNLEEYKIPLVIFSAGIGNVIHELLKHKNILFDNIRIVSNFMNFNNEGILTGFQDRIIHTFNKTAKSIQDSEFFENICSRRRNIILLGDSTGDPNMSDGFEHDSNVLKIGFLNSDVENLKEKYMEMYDIVIVTDETFGVPSLILNAITHNEAIK